MHADIEPGARCLCSKEHQQHLELQPKLKAGYTKTAKIPIDGVFETNELGESLERGSLAGPA